MMSDCRRFKRAIEAAEKSEDLELNAKAHMEFCSDCRTLFERQVNLRQIILGLERVEAPGDFDFRLRARMASSVTTGGRRLSLGFTPGFVSVSLAAVFAVAIIGAYLARQETSPPADAESGATLKTSLSTDTVSVEGNVALKMENNPTISSGQEVVAGEIEKTKPKRSRGSLPTSAASDRRSEAVEFGLHGMRVIARPNVSLKVSSEPLDVFIRDENGTLRRVSMKSVSFGAQQAVGRTRDVPLATASNQEGVW